MFDLEKNYEIKNAKVLFSSQLLTSLEKYGLYLSNSLSFPNFVIPEGQSCDKKISIGSLI
jgi:hypothetical protein